MKESSEAVEERPAAASEINLDFLDRRKKSSKDSNALVDDCIEEFKADNQTSKKNKKTWLTSKQPERKTYKRQLPAQKGFLDDIDDSIEEEDSPALTGEQVSGDEEFIRRSGLPLVAADSRVEKVDRWLEAVEYHDPESQPSPGQRHVSTPQQHHLHKTLSTDLSSAVSPIMSGSRRSSQPLSPLNTNTLKKRSVSTIPDETTPFSQAVDVNDTFDKTQIGG